MLHTALAFCLIALMVGLFGFWGLAGLVAAVARGLCVFFLILGLLSLIRTSH